MKQKVIGEIGAPKKHGIKHNSTLPKHLRHYLDQKGRVSMARNIAGRLKRIEKLTMKKHDDWLAIIEDDATTILMQQTGKNINMTTAEFEEWKKNKPEGRILLVEWVGK